VAPNREGALPNRDGLTCMAIAGRVETWGTHRPAIGSGLAMLLNLAGVTPAWVTASHGPGIEPCKYRGDAMLDS
jgi:hypothetical protein